jgi:hypothetical protein
MFKRRIVPALLALAVLASAPPRPAAAMDRDVRSVLVGGGYGLLGGAVLGLVAYPITQNPRSIAVGTSIGLYLGLALGFYYVWERDNPENPLRPDASLEIRAARVGPDELPRPLVQAEWVVQRF